VIFSTTDYYAAAVSRNRERLESHFTISDPPWHQSQIFLEKDLTYGLAAEVGVAHPGFFKPKTMTELEQGISGLKMPVMIKPVHSHRFCALFKQKLFVNETMDELRSNFQRVLDAGLQVIVCEIIPGTDYKTLETVQVYINRKGDCAVNFCCIKLRQTPPMYGVIRVGRSVEPSRELIEPALRLLRKVDYRGYASIEFKRDQRDGILKLMEVNMRTLRMAQLPIASGVDFPYMMIRDLLHDDQIVIDDYDTNTYYIDIVADIADSIRYDTDRDLLRYLEPYRAKRKTYSFLSLSDPKPFFRHVLNSLSKAVTKRRADFSVWFAFHPFLVFDSIPITVLC